MKILLIIICLCLIAGFLVKLFDDRHRSDVKKANKEYFEKCRRELAEEQRKADEERKKREREYEAYFGPGFVYGDAVTGSQQENDEYEEAVIRARLEEQAAYDDFIASLDMADD